MIFLQYAVPGSSRFPDAPLSPAGPFARLDNRREPSWRPPRPTLCQNLAVRRYFDRAPPRRFSRRRRDADPGCERADQPRKSSAELARRSDDAARAARFSFFTLRESRSGVHDSRKRLSLDLTSFLARHRPLRRCSEEDRLHRRRLRETDRRRPCPEIDRASRLRGSGCIIDGIIDWAEIPRGADTRAIIRLSYRLLKKERF